MNANAKGYILVYAATGRPVCTPQCGAHNSIDAAFNELAGMRAYSRDGTRLPITLAAVSPGGTTTRRLYPREAFYFKCLLSSSPLARAAHGG